MMHIFAKVWMIPDWRGLSSWYCGYIDGMSIMFSMILILDFEKEAYLGLTHTVGTCGVLMEELLLHNVLKSIVTGKFQTDHLESRFSHYRHLSGDSFRCFAEIKMFTVKRLLTLYSASKGTISIRSCLNKFNDVQAKYVPSFSKYFLMIT